jgi:hypothetical protein
MLRLLSLFLHAFIAWRLLPELSQWPILSAALGLALVNSVLLMPMGIGLASRLAGFGHRTTRLVTWLAWAGMGFSSTLLILTLVRELLMLAVLLADLAWPGWLALASWRSQSAFAVALLGFLITLLGFSNARRTAAITRVSIPIKNLPAALQGFRIVQISDIHVGPTIRQDYLRRIVRQSIASSPIWSPSPAISLMAACESWRRMSRH